MQLLEPVRKVLFAGSLSLLALSVALDHKFANDLPQTLPEPNALSLLAIGGVLGIALALIRRRKK